MPLRIGVHFRAARAPRRARTAIEDTAALLSLHGHRVVDLAAGRPLVDRLRGRAPGIDDIGVLLHLPGHPVDPAFPTLVRVRLAWDDPVEIGFAGRRGLAAEVRELVRLVRADRTAVRGAA